MSGHSHVRAFAHFYLNPHVTSAMSKDYWKVACPSLATKTYGRSLMVTGCITFKSLASFIIMNLTYAAPPIALIAGLMSAAITVYKARKKKEPWKKALQEAAVAFLKTSVKFFIVYMGWVIGMGLAVSLGVMAGPYLFLGLCMVGVVTALSLFIANVIVEVIPNMSKGMDVAWQSLVRAFTEGFVWALVEHLSISTLLGGGWFGKAVDVIAVSFSVACSYVLGGMIDSCYRHYISYKKSKLKKVVEVKNLTALISKLEKLPGDMLNQLTKIKHQYSDQKHLTVLIEKYIKSILALQVLRMPSEYVEKEELMFFLRQGQDGPFGIFWCSQSTTSKLLTRAQNSEKPNLYRQNAVDKIKQRKANLVEELKTYGLFGQAEQEATHQMGKASNDKNAGEIISLCAIVA